MARTISDADRRLMRRRRMREADRTVSDADQAAYMRRLLGESGRGISDADRLRAQEAFLRGNDGGKARKTRIF